MMLSNQFDSRPYDVVPSNIRNGSSGFCRANHRATSATLLVQRERKQRKWRPDGFPKLSTILKQCCELAVWYHHRAGVDEEAGIQRRLATARKEMKEYGSVQWDSTILSVEGDIDRGAQELRRIATRLVGMPESSLAEDDEPVESPDPVQDGAAVPPAKSVFGEFSGLARMLGDSCVDLGQGFPNFDPPEFVVKALRDELDGTVPGAVRTRHQYTRRKLDLGEALLEEEDENGDSDQWDTAVCCYAEQVRALFLHHSEARGPCYARARIQQELFQAEDYYFQLDSHFRMIPKWDEELLEQLAMCNSEKPILSTYPSSYTLPEEGFDRRLCTTVPFGVIAH
eukprot:Skav235822  [mRNA]  locus=scaffold1267:417953:440179:- [translate_table: standard]